MNTKSAHILFDDTTLGNPGSSIAKVIPLQLITKHKKGKNDIYVSMGSFQMLFNNNMAESLDTLEFPDWVNYDHEQLRKKIVIPIDLLAQTKKKTGLELTLKGPVTVIDLSDKCEFIKNFVTNNVKLSDTGKFALGKQVWIVVKGVYCGSFTSTVTKKRFFKSSQLSYSYDHLEDPLLIAFSCLRFDVADDGKLKNGVLLKK